MLYKMIQVDSDSYYTEIGRPAKRFQKQAVQINDIFMTDYSCFIPASKKKTKRLPLFLINKNRPRQYIKQQNTDKKRSLVSTSPRYMQTNIGKIKQQRKVKNDYVAGFNQSLLTPFNFTRPRTAGRLTSRISIRSCDDIKISNSNQSCRQVSMRTVNPKPCFRRIKSPSKMIETIPLKKKHSNHLNGWETGTSDYDDYL